MKMKLYYIGFRSIGIIINDHTGNFIGFREFIDRCTLSIKAEGGFTNLF